MRGKGLWRVMGLLENRAWHRLGWGGGGGGGGGGGQGDQGECLKGTCTPGPLWSPVLQNRSPLNCGVLESTP